MVNKKQIEKFVWLIKQIYQMFSNNFPNISSAMHIQVIPQMPFININKKRVTILVESPSHVNRRPLAEKRDSFSDRYEALNMYTFRLVFKDVKNT